MLPNATHRPLESPFDYHAGVRVWLSLVVVCAGCDVVFSTDEVSPPPAEVCGVPSDIPANIHVTGTLLDAAADTPVGGASVDAMPGGVATTDSSGMFAIDVATGAHPLHLELVVSGAHGYPAHEIYYQRAFATTPADVTNKLLSTLQIDQLYGGVSREANAGTLLVSLRDCNENGVADQLVEVTPTSTVLYQGGGARTNGTGVAYGLNVPQGAATIRAGTADPFAIEVSPGAVALVFVVQP
jgi:hypothetical protein